MPRYFTIKQKANLWVEDEAAWDCGSPVGVPSVCEHEATDTGLLDENGDWIMRAPNPVGFGKDEEW